MYFSQRSTRALTRHRRRTSLFEQIFLIPSLNADAICIHQLHQSESRSRSLVSGARDKREKAAARERRRQTSSDEIVTSPLALSLASIKGRRILNSRGYTHIPPKCAHKVERRASHTHMQRERERAERPKENLLFPPLFESRLHAVTHSRERERREDTAARAHTHSSPHPQLVICISFISFLSFFFSFPTAAQSSLCTRLTRELYHCTRDILYSLHTRIYRTQI